MRMKAFYDQVQLMPTHALLMVVCAARTRWPWLAHMDAHKQEQSVP